MMIETSNLGRSFGDLKAVDGVNFKAQRGDVLGFLGPNGAGKSTTMKMLTCFLTPSTGTAKINGFDILTQPREVRSQIGYLPENAPLYGEMTVVGFLEFIAEVRGIEGSLRKSAIERVVNMTSLQGVTRQRIETLSKGFKRRVGLAQALIHDPQILILDEPTDGLDPNQKHEVRELINRMAKEKCILLSTHILEEVEAVCNRVIIVARGKIVFDDTPEAFRKCSKKHGAVTVHFGEGVKVGSEELKKLSGVKEVEVATLPTGGNSYTLYPAPGRQILSPLIKEAEMKNWSFQDLQLETGVMEEVFRQITQ